ncbi:hypothetical protein PV458_36465 [Streptomyces sp. MN03-5084-2B]|nr:hypothetical protein [Streptomyces sp. MN03-5084-2B]
MTQKITAKNWAVRVLGATVAAGAMLTAVALPASATTFWAYAKGKSEQQAVQNVKYVCMFERGGTMTGPITTYNRGVENWFAQVPCEDGV